MDFIYIFKSIRKSSIKEIDSSLISLMLQYASPADSFEDEYVFVEDEKVSTCEEPRPPKHMPPAV